MRGACTIALPRPIFVRSRLELVLKKWTDRSVCSALELPEVDENTEPMDDGFGAMECVHSYLPLYMAVSTVDEPCLTEMSALILTTSPAPQQRRIGVQ